MTTASRFAELAGLLKEGHMSVDDFAKKSEAERIKFLWQWSTSKQMDLAEWKPYLAAHAKACQ